MKITPEFKKSDLLWVAAIVWVAAGAMLIFRGVVAIEDNNLSIGVLAGVLFYFALFRRIVDKHTERILSLPGEVQKIYRFFNRRSYFLMFSMIALGMSVRFSGIVPIQYLTTFYVVMGIPLFVAGIHFIFKRLSIK